MTCMTFQRACEKAGVRHRWRNGDNGHVSNSHAQGARCIRNETVRSVTSIYIDMRYTTEG